MAYGLGEVSEEMHLQPQANLGHFLVLHSCRVQEI